MSTLFFDTETTGLVRTAKPSSDPEQPNLVQLGAMLFNDDDEVIGELRTIVKTNGWEIESKARETHGISEEIADKYGVDHDDAFWMFLGFLDVADTVVAHNITFDKIVMEKCAIIEGENFDIFKDKEMICTMKSSVNVLKLPRVTRSKYGSNNNRVPRGYKWPTLEECSQYYLKKSIINAHDAMVDVRACSEIYFVMKEMGLPLHD